MKHFVICGAAPDTGNLGVSALGNAAISALDLADPSTSFSVLDSGKGLRRTQMHLARGAREVTLCGARYSNKVYLPESFHNIGLAARIWPGFNPMARHLLGATAFLDVAGGDSFTDLYGAKRFSQVNAAKEFALANRIPLVLLPQTYGPYLAAETRARAAQLARAAELAWARDAHSFSILQDLLGSAFDPQRHRLGVDMAFALPRKDPGSKLDRKVAGWLAQPERPLLGINVSGLIYNAPDKARDHYRFRADYNEALRLLVTRIMAETDANLVIIPHVLTPQGHYESDYQASLALLEQAGLQDSARVAVQAPILDQCEVKGLISQLDWFMGTRMHATIAALSTCTPVCTISYSDKALGVFESCGVGDSVVDPRKHDTLDVVEAVLADLQARAQSRQRLQARLPAVVAMAEQQMAQIAGHFSGR